MLLRIPKLILRPSRKALVIGSSIACFVWGAISISLLNDHPFLSDHIELKVRFEGNSYNEQPILSGGLKGASDLIYVQYINNDTAKFGYRSTGGTNYLSKPVHLIRNQEHNLGVWSPTLIIYNGSLYEPNAKIKVIVDGTTVIDQEGTFHMREPEEISLGRNQDYDNVTKSILEGVISRMDRKSIEWYLQEPESRKIGIENFFIALPRRLFIPLFLCGLLIILFWPFYHKKDNAIHLLISWLSKNKLWEKNKWPLLTISFCAFVYIFFITNGSFKLFENDFFSNFYDYQGVSILHGHLDVPTYAIQFEAFVYKGKSYGYFGIIPGLLRIPFILLGICFGKVTRLYMIIEYTGILVLAYLINLKIRNYFIKYVKIQNINVYLVIWLINLGLGTTLIFTSSHANVYHEAIITATFFSLFSFYFIIDYIFNSNSIKWVYSIILSVMCLNSRPTIGVFTISFIAISAAINFITEIKLYKKYIYKHLFIILLCLVSFSTLEVINYIKFNVFDTQPYKYYILNNPQRNARTGGKHFFLSDIPWNANAYLWGSNFILDREFPYIYAKWPNPAKYLSAKIDHIEPIVSIPYTHLGLLLIIIYGLFFYKIYDINCKKIYWIILLSMFPLVLFFLGAPFQSERYKADFACAFIVLSVMGLCTMYTKNNKIIKCIFLILLSTVSIIFNISITIQYRRERPWTVPHQVKSDWDIIVKEGY